MHSLQCERKVKLWHRKTKSLFPSNKKKKTIYAENVTTHQNKATY